jgi:hypothetical protein
MVCRAWAAGGCEFGDSCIFSHSHHAQGLARETIGSRAFAVQGVPGDLGQVTFRSDSDSGSRESSSSSARRSWADQSEDIWPESSLPPPGPPGTDLAPGHQVWDTSSSSSRAAGTDTSRGHTSQSHSISLSQKSSVRCMLHEGHLPRFDDRLDFPEFIPGPPGSLEPYKAKQPPTKSARRRKQRELADRRTEFRDMNLVHADRAVQAALRFNPSAPGAFARQLDFPRSEAESPLRPPAPWPTPRPDQPRDKAGAGEALEPEDEDPEDEPGPARAAATSTTQPILASRSRLSATNSKLSL